MGTTAQGAVTSTNYSPFRLGGATQRLGERRSLGSQKAIFLGSNISVPQPQILTQPRRGDLQIRFALFDPPPFDPAKLNITYLPGTAAADTGVPQNRRYTLTHNDLTGRLYLSVGLDYNEDQLAGWYTRIVRDEILAEWAVVHPSDGSTPPRLNVYCHVSGEELWPAPPRLRSFIFQREMKLVLDTIAYADRTLLAEHPQLASATVFVHLVSDLSTLNKVVEWGSLGDRSTWLDAGVGKNIFNELVSSLSGSMSSMDGDNEEQQVLLSPPTVLPPTQQQQQEEQQEHSEESIVEEHESPSSSGATNSTTTTTVSTLQAVAATATATAPREVERRTSTLAGRARGVVTAAISRSPPPTAANTRRQQ